MEFNPKNPKQRKIEDKDKNFRLRYGLNVHCLAYIFQYLDTADLYTVGGMDEFFEQIINNLIISKHKVNFDELIKRNIRIRKVFERYGKKIRKILFTDYSIQSNTS